MTKPTVCEGACHYGEEGECVQCPFGDYIPPPPTDEELVAGYYMFVRRAIRCGLEMPAFRCPVRSGRGTLSDWPTDRKWNY